MNKELLVPWNWKKPKSIDTTVGEYLRALEQ